MKSIMLQRFVFLVSIAALPVAESFAAAGKFNFVIGDVRVVSATGSRTAMKDGEVEAKESIVSGPNGMAQLRMSDGAFISVRADTELRIEKYKFSGKADASSESVLSLVKGTLRAFTGAIASYNKDKFKMRTPSATIGIRGSGNVLNFSPVDNVTLNHTIEGSHVVMATDPSGALRTLVTVPGQTVQISALGAMQFVQTPTFILNAAAGVPDARIQAPRQQQNQQPGNGGQGQAPGTPNGEPGGPQTGQPGMQGANGPAGPTGPGMMPRVGGVRPAGMPGMYVGGAGDPAGSAKVGGAPAQPGMYNPAMPGPVPAIDPVTGMPMAPPPGMYAAAPLPGMASPTAMQGGMYPPTTGVPYNDPAMAGAAPGTYGPQATMPGMYGPAVVMPYNTPAMPAAAPGMYAPAPMPAMYPPAVGMSYTEPMKPGTPGMYAPAPMSGMYGPMTGMPYNTPAMTGTASGMYNSPAAMPGMYASAPMPGMYAPTPGMSAPMYNDPSMMAAPGMYAPAPMPGMYGSTAAMAYNTPAMTGTAPGMYNSPAAMPGMYDPAPMPAMYAPAPGMPATMYNDPAMMATTPGMYGPTPGLPYTVPAMTPTTPGMYSPAAMPAGVTNYNPVTGMNATYIPPTTYIAQYGYDAMGNLLPGYILMNGIPTLQTSAPYGYQYDFYGSLTLMPGFSLDAFGNAYPTGATARFGFDANGLLLSGYAIDTYGNAYPTWNPPTYGYTYDFNGNKVLAPGFTRDIYGNVTMINTGVVGWIGGPCSGYSAPGGAYCDPATNTYLSVGGTTYSAGWIGGPCAGYNAPTGAFCDYTTNTFITTGTGNVAAVGTMCTGYGMVSGSLYCNGATWETPAAGAACSGAATVGNLYCNGAQWLTMAGGAASGTACSGVGTVSGSLYCDGSFWKTPAVGFSCNANGLMVGGFTCSANMWQYTGTTGVAATAGSACAMVGTISGSLYCDGLYWMYPTQGSWCTGAATVGSLSCTANIWTMSAATGTPCGAVGSISGSLYCNGANWITPQVNTACSNPGLIVGTFTCSGSTWISTAGAFLGGACAGVGTVSGSFTCDGGTWIQAGSYCYSSGMTAGSLVCSNNLWSYSGGAVVGGTCTALGTQSGSLYCDGAMWVSPMLNNFCSSPGMIAGGLTCTAGFWTSTGGGTAVAGNSCTAAGSVSGTLYCNGYTMTWGTPTPGGNCLGSVGLLGMVCNGATWGIPTYGTPGFATPPTGMYDAFQQPVPLLPAYKNIGYLYNLNGSNSFEIALNDTSTISAGTGGGLSSFRAPSVPGTSSVNSIQLDQGAALALDLGYDPLTGMTWGRWQGGPVSLVTIGSTPTPNTTNLGSLHWFSTGTQNQAVTLPTTGIWNYSLIGKTNPTDNTGVIGTLNSATFSANFTAQQVNIGVNVSMPASTATSALPVTLNANAVNVPILAGGNFKDVAPSVTCGGSGCASPVGSGVIGGQFSAPTGQGVGVGYGLVNGAQTVNGVAVFQRQ